jgi:hypothetical protein
MFLQPGGGATYRDVESDWKLHFIISVKATTIYNYLKSLFNSFALALALELALELQFLLLHLKSLA